MKNIFLALVMLCSLQSEALTIKTKKQIVASFPILRDIVYQITSSAFETSSLIPLGEDVHGYKVRAQDILRLEKADLILTWGLGLDQSVIDLTEKAQLKNKTFVVTDGIDKIEVHTHSNHLDHSDHKSDHGAYDPHLWQSPEKMILVVENVSKLLVQKFPEQKNDLESATKAYSLKLKDLSQNYKAQFKEIPDDQKRIITSHAAFAYLGQEMGIKINSVQGLDSEQTPSLKTMQTLIKTVKAEKIKALFREEGQNPQLLEKISKQTGVPIKGTLYSDSFSHKAGVTQYHELIESNLRTLLNALKEGPQ